MKQVRIGVFETNSASASQPSEMIPSSILLISSSNVVSLAGERHGWTRLKKKLLIFIRA